MQTRKINIAMGLMREMLKGIRLKIPIFLKLGYYLKALYQEKMRESQPHARIVALHSMGVYFGWTLRIEVCH